MIANQRWLVPLGIVAVLALALADTGREREAAGLAIGALARHLPRYNRSMAAYAEELSGR